MDFLSATLRYYSHWLAETPTLLASCAADVLTLPCAAREQTQPGYASPFHLYIWMQPTRTLISYGKTTAPLIETLSSRLSATPSVSAMQEAVAQVYHKTPAHQLKFLYTGSALTATRARTLTMADADAYLAFFRAANPACADTSWVPEYFADMAASGYCCGVFENGLLVSCTDAPDMPFLADSAQEIGINTLPAYRGKGYAAEAAALCATNIVRSGKCPLWSCRADNTASAAVARKIGFVPLADVLTLSL